MSERKEPWLESSASGWASKPAARSIGPQPSTQLPKEAAKAKASPAPDWRAMQADQDWRGSFRRARSANPAFDALEAREGGKIAPAGRPAAPHQGARGAALSKARSAALGSRVLLAASAMFGFAALAGAAWLGAPRSAHWAAAAWTLPATLASAGAAVAALGAAAWLGGGSASKLLVPSARPKPRNRSARPAR